MSHVQEAQDVTWACGKCRKMHVVFAAACWFSFPITGSLWSFFCWLVNRLVQGGSREIHSLFFFVGFFCCLFLLSTYQSDIAAAETHDRHFAGRVVKTAASVRHREPSYALIGAVWAPGAHLIPSKQLEFYRPSCCHTPSMCLLLKMPQPPRVFFQQRHFFSEFGRKMTEMYSFWVVFFI